MQCLEQFSIVWQECGPNSRAAERFFVPSYEGYLPFFVWGEDVNALQEKKAVELREEHLLKGLLYGLYEFKRSPKPWHREEDQSTFYHLIKVLTKGFNFPSIEQMSLDVASNVREVNGNAASRIMLEGGNILVPESSKIKSDLICDLWAVLSENGRDVELLEEVVNLLSKIDLIEIHSSAREVVCYYGFCALALLDRAEELYYFLEDYIYPNVNMPVLKSNIKSLMEGSDSETHPRSLKVT